MDQYTTTYLVTHPELVREYKNLCVRSASIGSSCTAESFRAALLNLWPESVVSSSEIFLLWLNLEKVWLHCH